MASHEQEGPVQEALDERALEMETLPQGRYIPYGGGSMGWFENQGVLKSERNNNYRFSSVMESEHVRAALFQRWGQHTDKRAAKQVAGQNTVSRLMSDESVPETAFQLLTRHGALSGTTRDVSHYGMRMHFKKQVPFSRGEGMKVQLMSHTDGSVALELSAVVVWVKREVVVWPVWFVGLAFQNLTEETERLVGDFLAR
jgi:hypothetical protein